jgi:DNA polymerase I-like protein with 3'-5' exonuclease and polymerase domains
MLEEKGVYFSSKDYQNDVLRPLNQEQEALRVQVFDHLKLNNNISLDNDPDLFWGLYRQGYKPLSLNLEYLKIARKQESIYDLLYQYKKNRQFLKQFGLKLLNQLDPTNHLHGHWSSDTPTGRLKCSSPALQAFPASVSKYFGAPPGLTRITGDYNLIEIRVLAQLSQDPLLILAFKEDIDIHSHTASIMYGKSLNSITSLDRKIGKQINFGIIYGIGSDSLFKILKKENALLTLEDAKQFRTSFFSTYRGVAQWQNKVLQAPIVDGLSGLSWSSFPSLNCRLNYPIQGSAAAGLKLALISLYKNLKPGWYISHSVHDEIQLIVPSSDTVQGKNALEQSMITGMSTIIKDVPIKVKIIIN